MTILGIILGLIAIYIIFQFAFEVGLIVLFGGIVWAGFQFGWWHQIFAPFIH